jgi:hypothetical protein
MTDTVTTATLARVSVHESGHAIAALHFRLPLLEVTIYADGSGKTSYTENFGFAEAERWTIVTYAGPEAEIDMFGDHHGDRSDLRAIDTMMQRLRLDWDESRLAELRREARHLVQCERYRIQVVADALIRHRRLSAFDVRWLKACAVPMGALA